MPKRRRSAASPLAAYRRALSQWTRLAFTQMEGGRRTATRALARTAAAPARAPLAGGAWLAGVAAGPAGLRRYRLYRPPGVAATERRPLLVLLHGCGQDPEGLALSTRMNRLAARAGCFVLYPEQDRSAHAHGCWHWYATRHGQAQREAATLAAAIDQVCLLYPVDATRVAVGGLSAGAGMAALMATREPARFCAVVMHSGVPPGAADSARAALTAMRGRGTVPPQGPDGAAWPPLLVIHGDADRVVAPSNADAAVELWAGHAGARAGRARRVQRGRRRAMAVTDYAVGGRLVARLCRIEGGGHAWSGGDARHPHGDPQGPDASRLAWSFVAAQFVPKS